MIRLGALLLALLVWAAQATPAAAHASLVRTDPADGAVLAEVPPHAVLTFNEPVTPLAIRLVSPGGMVLTPQVEVHGNSVGVALPGGLPRGTNVLSWRVTSEDGHPVAGSLIFSIGAPSGHSAARPAPDPSVAAAIWAARLLLYLGLLTGVGGAFFVAWTAVGATLPTTASRAILTLLVVGLVAAPAALGLQGLDALGLGFSGLLTGEAWRAALATSYRWTVLAAALGLLLGIAATLGASRRTARGASLAGLVAVGIAFAASGHASAASPEWLTRPAVFVHAIAVAFWVGALVPLAALLHRDDSDAITALRRFSAAIPYPLAALVLAGTILAIVQVGDPRALWTTPYGWVLDAKLVALALLFALAWFNRCRLTRKVEGSERGAARVMARTILAETLVVLLVLGIVALWRFTPPPRSEAAAAAQRATASLHLHSPQAMVNLAITPARPGPVRAEISVFDAALQPIDPKEVVLSMDNQAAGIERIRHVAKKGPDGTWTAEFAVPVPGIWKVRVEVLISDFSKATVEGDLDVTPAD